MAMLAEPRRKQKVINLRAKNNAWSNDSTKFGQRMLEKMGWKSGKGLGAKENGITEHVVARYKNDEKGLGFEDKNDQWTKHEDDFNALLANLSNANDNNENLHSGVSLEDKSKKSKARIHYHKFTRGKDISRYSEKDLANIFGKKSFKAPEVSAEPITEDLKTSEQVFTEKGSMEDYFKYKLAAFKSKSKVDVSNFKDNEDSTEPSYAFCGFSEDTNDAKVHDGEVAFGFGYNTKGNIEHNENSENSLECHSVNIKKKKKKSKNLDNIEQSKNDFSDDIQNETQYLDHNQDCIEKIKKKKKSKSKPTVDMQEKTQNGSLNMYEHLKHNATGNDEIIKKKKKSKNKSIDNDLLENSCVQQLVETSKKKKSKITEPNDIIYNNIHEENIELKSKKRHNQNFEDAIENITEVPKKKKKKNKNQL